MLHRLRRLALGVLVDYAAALIVAGAITLADSLNSPARVQNRAQTRNVSIDTSKVAPTRPGPGSVLLVRART